MDLDGRCFIRRGRTLVPADFAADEMLDSIPENKEVILTYRKARSPEHHRWFWKLLSIAAESAKDDRFSDPELLLDALKLETGHVRAVKKLGGDVILIPKSISFASMPQDKFVRFVDRSLYVLAKFLGVDPVTLMKETDAREGKNYGKGKR